MRARTAQPGESCGVTVFCFLVRFFFFLDLAFGRLGLAFVWRFGSLAYALFISLLVEELLQIEKIYIPSW